MFNASYDDNDGGGHDYLNNWFDLQNCSFTPINSSSDDSTSSRLFELNSTSMFSNDLSDFTGNELVTDEKLNNKATTVQSASIQSTGSKKGRGRGSRGSYKTRGTNKVVKTSKKKAKAKSSSEDCASSTTVAQRVYINPEILKKLGYSSNHNINLTQL